MASPAASRMRRYRAPATAGKIILRHEVDEADLTACLIADGLLDPVMADDRAAIEAAFGELVKRYLMAQRRYA